MKILWLCPELPYPLTTGLLRVYSLLRELGRRHQITFVCLTRRKSVPSETIDALSPYTTSVSIHSEWSYAEPWRVKAVANVPFLGPRVQERWRKRRAVADMNLTVKQLCEKENFDVLLFGGRYTLPALKNLNVPLVVDCCDAHCGRFLGEMRHAPLIRRPLIFLRYLLMRRLERKVAGLSPYVSFISERDRKVLLGPAATSEILQQGVDYNYWQRSSSAGDQNCIVFTGAMDYSPNDDAARFLIDEVLPLVRQAIPKIQVQIVGRDPLPALMNAAQPFSDTTVTGAVPDMRPYLERAAVYVAPLRFASGVQNKVLEAMALELPVVTTPVVADALVWDGVRAPVVVAKRADEIAEQIIRLLNDSERRSSLGQQGREFVVEHCRWSRSAEKLESMCTAAAMSAPARYGAPVHVEKQCA